MATVFIKFYVCVRIKVCLRTLLLLLLINIELHVLGYPKIDLTRRENQWTVTWRCLICVQCSSITLIILPWQWHDPNIVHQFHHNLDVLLCQELLNRPIFAKIHANLCYRARLWVKNKIKILNSFHFVNTYLFQTRGWQLPKR